MLGVVLDRLRIQDFSVVLANIEVLVVVIGEGDLLIVVTELEVGNIVVHLHRSLIRSTGLLALLRLLLQLLDFLGALLRLAVEVPLVDLTDQNGSLCPVSTLDTQANLLQDELRLFPPCHRSKGLHLQLAQDISCGIKVALRLLDVRKDPGHAGSLDFNEDLVLLAASSGWDV